MRVLLVEDDPMIGEAIQGALKDASWGLLVFSAISDGTKS